MSSSRRFRSWAAARRGCGAVDAVAHAGLLLAYPVAQVGVDEALQVLGVELVVVHQRGEAVLQAVPHMPDEGAVVEALGVLLEELLAQPDVQALAGAVGIGQQLVEHGGLPAAGLHGLPGGNQQLEQAVMRGRLAAHRGQADDAVVVGVLGQHFAAGNPGAGLVGQFHRRVGLGRPAVAGQAGDGDLQRVGGGLRVAVEQPLGGVVGVRLGQAVGVALGGDLLPVGRGRREPLPAWHW